jgi:two-component system chemotaxis response regulator CheY
MKTFLGRRKIMKILIVEDSKFVQNMTSKLIGNHFPEVQMLTAADGETGYRLFCSEQPDIILTDLLMPKLTGQELIRLIKQDDPNSRVVVLSADVQKITRDELDQLGILAFINKPLDAEKAERLVGILKEIFYA